MKNKPTLNQQANSFLFKKAKQLRRNTTPAEDELWKYLRARRFMNLKFRQQHPIGKYIADFYCHELLLVVEVDGGYHLTEEQKAKDDYRDLDMSNHDLHIIRLTNEEVLNEIEAVFEKLRDFIEKLDG